MAEVAAGIEPKDRKKTQLYYCVLTLSKLDSVVWPYQTVWAFRECHKDSFLLGM